MSLYIANTTKQHWNLCFRVPESHRPYFAKIPSGEQVEVGKNWTMAQIDGVIKEIQRYGARHASEVSGKLDKFAGILYSTSRPISEDHIVTGHDAVVDHQELRSAEEAVRAAKAFDTVHRDKKSRKRRAKMTAVEVEQDVPDNVKPNGNEVHFSLSVAEDGAPDVTLKR